MDQDAELEPVNLDERRAPVIVDIKHGKGVIAVRFSAAHTTTDERGGMKFETWHWAAGRPGFDPDGEVCELSDVMNGTTTLREASSCPETIAKLMIESWLINHGRDWALAFTDASRDLNGRKLRPDGTPAEIEG